MGCQAASGTPINCFALVNYIPGELGRFLNQLRQELVTGCHAQSHVTLLPPRSLRANPAEAWDTIQAASESLPPFDVTLDSIEVFPGTNVIYLAIRQGYNELKSAHSSLCHGALDNREAFPYHPHVTLAQGLEPEYVDASVDLARHRWRQYTGPRSFQVNDLVFVQCTNTDDWLDLEALQLSSVAVPANSL
ncbi:MAG: 2'-5' RNA ligase family protein [Bryobacteraceae bacterium]|nr:2'-5' RNA ligase family protein [Bryobacteraceae bacterium]